MEYKKRNGFFVFCFSFIPGAVEMYMGFMKNGVSLLATFVMVCLVSMYGYSFISAVAFGLLVVIWFYAFFHAWNLYRLNGDILMKLEDKYIWTEFGLPKEFTIKEEKLRRATAIALILIGACTIWDSLLELLRKIIIRYFSEEFWFSFRSMMNSIPRLAIAVIFIYAGIKLIKGKKKELGITSDAEQE